MEVTVFSARSTKFTNKNDVIAQNAKIFRLCEISPNLLVKFLEWMYPAWFDGLFLESGSV